MAMQDDFAAVKYHPPFAVYCGSVPRFKPRYTVLRGGSTNSNLQFYGSSWSTEEEGNSNNISRVQQLLCSFVFSHGSAQGGGNGKKSLGMALFPPIPKSVRPSDGAPDSTALCLPSSQHLDFQEAWEMRARSGRRSEEKTHTSAGRSAHLFSVSAGFDPLPDIGTDTIFPSISQAGRERAGTALRQRVERLSLPSIPVIGQNGRLPRKSSANSLLVIAAGIPERGEEPEWEDTQEARAFPHPQQELLNALTWLGSNDWEQKTKGLFNVRCLAAYHSEVLLCRLHDVSLAVTKEVNNPRSKVSGSAIRTLGELFRTMKECMDHEVDGVAQVLLQRMGHSNEFIQKATDTSLEIMVGSVTPPRAMTALMASGIQHHNVLVRKCATKHLLTVVEQLRAKKVMKSTRVNASLLVSVLVQLAQDCHQDTRCYALKMLSILSSHRKFDKYLKQSVPSNGLADIMAKIKQKGIEDHKCEPLSVKSSGKARNSGLMLPQDELHSDGRSGSDGRMLPRRTEHCRPLRTVEEVEQLSELYKLLTANEFQRRMEGVELLLDHCRSSPRLISTNIVQIFDVFVLRLQDCNKKVSQRALEALALMTPVLKGALHAVLVALVAAVTDNLNSKHMGIYSAAVKALEASIAYLDNSLLLQELASRVRFLRGQALQIITESLSVLVSSVYPWKPQAIHRCALPTLWFFLGNRTLPLRGGNIGTAVIRLAKTLYKVMGSKLKELAKSQTQHVAQNLWSILDLTDEGLVCSRKQMER
ncbi:TOG array regulator of axonemal microtubules protein 2 [Falco cherrug]|uniref:TOG array regulator of axonemal microtubules protein 2 n=1 Tax=Falco cherrug TaxID=345164 RepID=UPI0024791A29|nr:TOG array regulator of axonemal microtubules protein 2 [Falco cherrug]